MRKSINVIVAIIVLLISSTIGCRGSKRPIDCAALVKALSEARQPEAALASLKHAADRGDGCQYAELGARAALDADLHGLVPKLLDAAPVACERAARLAGERAEALARAGQTENADAAARSVLEADRANPYADLALARVAYDKGQMTNTSDLAARALADGRGAEAERLLGRSALARGLFKEAEAHFQSLLAENPNDAEAAFTAGVCNDELGRYMQAREAFLHTLRIDPKHQMARWYLVMLTHNAGFNEEARHHLMKLGEVIPKDSPQYQQLKQLLESNTGGAGTLAASVPANGSLEGKR